MSQTFIPIVSVSVADWSKVGPLTEYTNPEDGFIYVSRPKTSLVILTETENGELYRYDWWYSMDEEKLVTEIAIDIERAGSIDLLGWVFLRNVYGTQAYLDEVAAMTPEERAR
jgi:hypothetical protein